MNLSLNSRSGADFKLSPIKVMELAAAKIPGVISLAQGIPSFDAPKVIRDFVIEKIASGACDKYSLTLGLPELRQEISRSLADEDLLYDADSEIIVSVGAIEAITATLLGVTNPGDEVIIPSPTYTSYQNAIKLAGCVPRFAELDEEHNFDFDIDNIARAITKKTRAIFYCNPNNPTGTTFSEHATREIVKLAEKYNLTIITDEVYRDFYYVQEAHYTPALIPEARARVVRIFSFSKAFAMTGWRVGFLHSDKSIVKKILPYHDAMVTCAPVASQYAALAALRFAGEIIPYFREEYRKRRDITLSALDQMSHIVDYQIPKAGYFVFPRVKGTVALSNDSEKLALDILEKAKLALVPGVAFGPSGESHLRISFGRDTKDVEEGMRRLTNYFSDKRSHRIQTTETEPNLISNQPSRSTQTQSLSIKSFLRPVVRATIKQAARIYLNRHNPIIIGIAGVRGKTVYKRVINDILSSSKKVRASILSYNTGMGMPLSILSLRTPASLSDKILFPWNLLKALFIGTEHPEILVLEYGMSSEQDALELLRVAKPNWLVLTDLTSPDTSLDLSKMDSAIKKVTQVVPKERILWSAEDAHIKSLGIELLDELKLNLGSFSHHSINIGSRNYAVSRETPGQSYRLATIAAVKLAERLGISEDCIRNYLAPGQAPVSHESRHLENA